MGLVMAESVVEMLKRLGAQSLGAGDYSLGEFIPNRKGSSSGTYQIMYIGSSNSWYVNGNGSEPLDEEKILSILKKHEEEK